MYESRKHTHALMSLNRNCIITTYCSYYKLLTSSSPFCCKHGEIAQRKALILLSVNIYTGISATCLTGVEDQSSTLLSSSRFLPYNQKPLFNLQSPITQPFTSSIKEGEAKQIFPTLGGEDCNNPELPTGSILGVAH